MRKKGGVLLASVLFLLLMTIALLERDVEEGRYEETVVGLLDKSIGMVREVRHLNFTKSVGHRAVDIEWVKKNWGLSLAAEEERELELLDEAYHILNLIPPEVSLVEIRKSQKGAAMAAAVGNDVYVVREYFEPEEEAYCVEILAHELTHVLQRQNLPAIAPELGDETRSWYSLIEGDALLTAEMVAQMYYDFEPVRVCLGHPENYTDPLRMIWLFPYAYGDDFVRHIYAEGGWELLNECYGSPPETTEHILHPDRYLSGEGFEWVDCPVPPGYEVILSDRMGEFFINVLIGVTSGWEMVEASTGWNGDNLTLQTRDDLKEGEGLLLWLTSWDSAERSSKFYEVLSLGLRRKASAISNYTYKSGGYRLALMLCDQRVAITGSRSLELTLESVGFLSGLGFEMRESVSPGP